MKITKIISGIAAGVLAAFCMTFTAFAEPKDIELSVARAVETNDPRVSKEIVKAFTIVYDSSICDCWKFKIVRIQT